MTELRILIVDDEALARSRMRRLLEDLSADAASGVRAVQVGESASAVQAMSLLQHERFDALLLDIHMPSVDGLQLAKGLSQL